MECIRCIIKANSLDHFKKTRRTLIIISIVIASILVSFSTAAAFLNSFTEDYIDDGDNQSDSPSKDRGLYLFGAVL